MRRYIVFIILILFVMVSAGCSKSTAHNASPEHIIQNNPNIDFFIMDGTIYVNAADVDWVNQLSIKEGKALGRINKTGVTKKFKDWDATKLNVDTEIYESEGRQDIVLAKVEGNYIPYIKYVEG